MRQPLKPSKKPAKQKGNPAKDFDQAPQKDSNMDDVPSRFRALFRPFVSRGPDNGPILKKDSKKGTVGGRKGFDTPRIRPGETFAAFNGRIKASEDGMAGRNKQDRTGRLFAKSRTLREKRKAYLTGRKEVLAQKRSRNISEDEEMDSYQAASRPCFGEFAKAPPVLTAVPKNILKAPVPQPTGRVSVRELLWKTRKAEKASLAPHQLQTERERVIASYRQLKARRLAASKPRGGASLNYY